MMCVQGWSTSTRSVRRQQPQQQLLLLLQQPQSSPQLLRQQQPHWLRRCLLLGSKTNDCADDDVDVDNDDLVGAVNRRQAVTKTTAAILGLLGATTTTVCHALTPSQAAVDYDGYAASYNQLDGGKAASALGIPAARQALLSQAQGHVLEIGVGTGLNLPYYYFWDDSRRENNHIIRSMTLVDISPGMLSECQTKWQELEATAKSTTTSLPPVRFITADATQGLAERLLGGGDSDGDDNKLFDTVIDTFSLCVMGDEGARKCLQQLRDVVRPHTGRILLLENTRSDQPWLARYQDVTAQTAASMGGKGCVYNQNVRDMIQQTDGLTIVQETSYATGLFRAFVVQRTA